MHTAIPLTVLATALACSLATAPAHARARVFVASYGDNNNPCTFGSPCKTFQQAVTVVDAGGEVTAIDSAGFGPINISKAVTITSPPGVEAGIVPNPASDAIVISAGPNDAVVLRGLTLNGSGVGGNGINFSSGGSLTVTDCVVQNFSQHGIMIQPSSGVNFLIRETILLKNAGVGINYAPPGSTTGRGTIDHVVANNNAFGIAIQLVQNAAPTSVAITNSITNENFSDGIYINYGASASNSAVVSVDSSHSNGNGNNGITGTGTSLASAILLGRSEIINNTNIGVFDSTNPDHFFSFANNQIYFNLGGEIGPGVLPQVPGLLH